MGMDGIQNLIWSLSLAHRVLPRFAGWPKMPRGRKPKKGAISQIHFIIPEDVQDYMARMGSMDSTSKLRCLLKKAIEDRVPKTIIEIKAKLMEMERARRSMGDTTRACHNKLIELGQTDEDIEKIYEDINVELGKKGIE